MPRHVRAAFTLIELLIVVVMLGIISWAVVPQFIGATNEAMAGNLKTQLKSLQNQIELYAVRNNGVYPFPSVAGAATWVFLTDSGAFMQHHNRLIKDPPINPAFSGPNKSGIEVVVGAARGSATNGWVWNATDRAIYASNFNETTGMVSTIATD
jgi:prepilin-type N-terminal cleavage/methylation domain-containing protein